VKHADNEVTFSIADQIVKSTVNVSNITYLSLPLVLTENARGIVFAISINDALDSSHLLEPLKLPTTDTYKQKQTN